MRGMESYRFLLFAVLELAILSSTLFVMSPTALNKQQSAFATFPGENGKIVFQSQRDAPPGTAAQIYVMNADGSEQTRLTNNAAHDEVPDWDPATTTEPPTTITDVIEKLISDIQNLEGFPESAKTRIVAFLERALALLSDDNPRNDASTCNIVGAFMNQVNANERRGTLTEDQSGDLTTQAEDIRNMLGC